MNFQAAIKNLAQAQQTFADLKRQFSMELNAVESARILARDFETVIRAKAIEYFETTGDLQPHDAVEIRQISKRHWNTRQNARQALKHAPQVLTIDPGAFKALAPQIASAINEFNTGMGDVYIFAALVGMLENLVEIDEKAMKELVEAGKADWATPIVTQEPTVFLSRKLGQYLIADPSEHEF